MAASSWFSRFKSFQKALPLVHKQSQLFKTTSVNVSQRSNITKLFQLLQSLLLIFVKFSYLYRSLEGNSTRDLLRSHFSNCFPQDGINTCVPVEWDTVITTCVQIEVVSDWYIYTLNSLKPRHKARVLIFFSLRRKALPLKYSVFI